MSLLFVISSIQAILVQHYTLCVVSRALETPPHNPRLRPTLAVPLQGVSQRAIPTQSPCYLSRAYFLGLA